MDKRYWIMFIGVIVLLGGCQQKTPKPETTVVMALTKTEGNSLADWKQTLEQVQEQAASAETIRGVELLKDGNPVFAVSYEPREYKNSYDCWAISVPYESMVSVDTETMYEYFEKLTSLKPVLSETDFSSTGIAASQTVIYIASYNEQMGGKLGQPEPNESITYTIGDKDGKGNYYVGVGSGQEVYLLSEETVDQLYGINPYDFILKVSSLIPINTVSHVTVEMDGESAEVLMESESAEIQVLYTAMMGVLIEAEIPPEAQLSDKRNKLLTLHYVRASAQAPMITQTYYEYDEEYASVNVNGTEYFLVQKQDVEDLKNMIAAEHLLAR